MTQHDDQALDALIKQAFEPVMTEPIPARMHLRPSPWPQRAIAAAILAIGIAVGLVASPYVMPGKQSSLAANFPGRAARAHAVFVTEVRHPVEVDAKQQEHLVAWLSKRLGTQLRIPLLANEGFELLGGRLLPGPDGAVAQFMYQDASGARLTLYVSRRSNAEAQTAFRFSQEGNVSVFYWIDRDFGYALSSEVQRPTLAKVANAVYRQLEP
jgi:anti-sigma factor RsiW